MSHFSLSDKWKVRNGIKKPPRKGGGKELRSRSAPYLFLECEDPTALAFAWGALDLALFDKGVEAGT